MFDASTTHLSSDKSSSFLPGTNCEAWNAAKDVEVSQRVKKKGKKLVDPTAASEPMALSFQANSEIQERQEEIARCESRGECGAMRDSGISPEKEPVGQLGPRYRGITNTICRGMKRRRQRRRRRPSSRLRCERRNGGSDRGKTPMVDRGVGKLERLCDIREAVILRCNEQYRPRLSTTLIVDSCSWSCHREKWRAESHKEIESMGGWSRWRLLIDREFPGGKEREVVGKSWESRNFHF